MTGRAVLAALVLSAWAGTLTWNGVRQFRGRDVIARELTMQRVGPGAATYRLERDSATVGLMLRSVDTLPGEVRITERWDVQLDSLRRVTITDVAYLTRDLRLARFETIRSGDAVALRVSGRLGTPTTLIWTATRDGETFSDTVESVRPWTVPGALPLLAVLAAPSVRTAGLTLFEPLSFRVQDVAPRLLRDSTWIIADSAAIDTLTVRFAAVTTDTLDAQLFKWSDKTPDALQQWVDGTGLPMQRLGFFGTRATRTADELARQDYRPRPRAASGPSR